MLADSLLESHFPSGAQRGWTTLTSFALQTLAIGAVLILPLIYTEGLPKLHLLSVGARVAPPPGLPATPTHAVAPGRKQRLSRACHGAVHDSGTWNSLQG